MSTADTALSITIKMAPGPEHRQEPVAPDKTTENSCSEVTNERDVENLVVGVETISNQSLSAESASTNTDSNSDSTSHSAPTSVTSDNKQEEPATLSTLNEGELRALLDEAITYKCPKDREGKSSLFKELLQEAEADETEEGRRIITNSRCLPGSNRRRHKRDSVSERLTHGGSLQNLTQPIASEFDSSFAYLTSGSSHTYGGSRRKNKKYTGPSVSARQREGGSLPSNVNASHSLASLANLDLLFDKKKGFCEERTVYDWTNKEKSKSLDKPSYTSVKKEEKEKDKKDIKKDSCESELDTRDKRGTKGKQGTNEMLESDNPPPEYKSDYMVIDLGDAEVGTISERNVGSTIAGVQRAHSLDTEDDDGIQMKIIEPRRPQYISRTTFDIAQTPVDTTIDFSLREHSGKQDKSKISVNGTEVTGTLSFQTFNSVKCGIGGTSNSSSTSQGKVGPSLCSVMSASLQTQNITMGSRYTAHTTASGEKKSLDENGNAVQNYNVERKKFKRKQDLNVIVYRAENVEGHRNEDIDSLINFIENKESKSKKGKPGNPVRVKTSSGAKPRSREKDSKREQLPAKLQKSNSLEEISKTKLEDLTTEKSVSSSGASSLSSQHGTINVALRRAKQRSTGDAAIDSRGDRRSWGTEEGQSIYCNDTGDDYSSRRNSNKKVNPETEHETEFLVVTKKKKSKKQRRSSSGSRAQNLATSGSYLQNSRGFSNEYRTPLSPELRRKSASSMPPSDKSDSSDSDSVHSLPVTSNTSKHNLSKIATSSGGTPQASYADIARMATINMTHSSVLNMSSIVPSMLNTSSWPTVPPKTPSEPDKIPQDYYPSLDELQHSDRKTKQHNFTHTNHILNLSFDKPPSPTLSSKMKNSTERKKAEAQKEAINKNIQVIKYVQDIEKMHQNLSQQEQKHANSINHGRNPNETLVMNPTQSKFANTITNCNSDSENNSNCSVVNNKDPVTNAKCSNSRTRRGYPQINQNIQNQATNDDPHFKKTTYSQHDENVKKSHNTESSGTHPENKGTGSFDDNEALKTTTQNTPKSSQEGQTTDSGTTKLIKNEKLTKITKEQSGNIKHEPVKLGNPISVNLNQDHQEEDVEYSKNKQLNTAADKDQSSKTESQISNKQRISRPAVILLDETSSDITKNNDLPTELRFGFEINEQLLLSEDSAIEETSTASSVFPSVVPPLINKPPSNFDRYPPIFERHMRCDKFTPNFMQPPNIHVTQQPMHPVIMQRLPCMGYPPRFPPPTCLPPPPTPPGIIEKYHQPKEDFSMLYVAPEEDINIQTYNHDKIVSFVGLAWDAVMREMPVTASGRIQFYSGQ
ncbi:PREDICTED: dentin sialophosphoprotein-like isoform X2 [Dufourea novaeangliae]|uniref:dentin sialophosphoprotein-like isoform X2 n=1 Tax=Dufourea novaeangliae TaxID=178035 RepID=UPI000766EBA6|nr:PREDICTED: dentin sialophosphoprotein-like isoform X2 [Dufourea novaeangliae]